MASSLLALLDDITTLLDDRNVSASPWLQTWGERTAA